MEEFFHQLTNGLAVGGIYALIALGYTMVYGILRLINFAHGDVFMVSGLMMVYAVTWMPLWLAIPFVIVFTVLLGFLIERAAYKPLRSAPRMSVMISAIGVSYLLQNLALYVTGGLNKNYPTIPWISDTVSIFGATTKMVTLVTPVLTLVLVVLLVLLINHTKIGMAMRAVAKDFETSTLMGIKINNVISMTFIIGSFLAAIGSMLFFTNYPGVTPTVGAMPDLATSRPMSRMALAKSSRSSPVSMESTSQPMTSTPYFSRMPALPRAASARVNRASGFSRLKLSRHQSSRASSYSADCQALHCLLYIQHLASVQLE